MTDGEPCTVRLVLYCPITQKAEVRTVRHGEVRDLIGLNIVFVDRLCADIGECDFCRALGARMLSRTEAVRIGRALGVLGGALEATRGVDAGAADVVDHQERADDDAG